MSGLSKAYLDAIDKIEKRIEDACEKAGHKEIRVIYAAYSFDEFDTPIDNLDEVPVRGKAVFKDEGNFWENIEEKYAKKYNPFKKIMDSPTWLEIAVAANEMILTTNDFHHVYLEDVRFNDDDDILICMGS
jgi:hypothetical protein